MRSLYTEGPQVDFQIDRCQAHPHHLRQRRLLAISSYLFKRQGKPLERNQYYEWFTPIYQAKQKHNQTDQREHAVLFDSSTPFNDANNTANDPQLYLLLRFNQQQLFTTMFEIFSPMQHFYDSQQRSITYSPKDKKPIQIVKYLSKNQINFIIAHSSTLLQKRFSASIFFLCNGYLQVRAWRWNFNRKQYLNKNNISTMAQRMSKRLQKEYESIQKNNQDMKVLLPNNDLILWHVNFQGAKGTLYEGENFTLQLRFTNEYPIESPEVIFIGHIPIHEHIYSNGFICLSILYDQWSPALTVSSICLSVLSMLSSAQKKIKPPNDAEFVKRAAGRGPKAFLWSYHDDKA